MRWIGTTMLALALLGLAGSGGKAEAAVVAGSSVPAFELVTFTGEVYNRELVKGQPTMLVFWASWCPVCRKELPNFSHFMQKDKPAQLRAISIGFSDLRGNIETYVKTHPEAFAYPSAFDIDNDTAQAFRVTATPTFVLLDAQGTIVLVHRGAGVLQNPKFREFVAGMKG